MRRHLWQAHAVRSEVILMDSVPSKSFHGIFDRVAQYIDLQGATSASEIKRRIMASEVYRGKIQKYSEVEKKWVDEKGSMQTLIEHGFHNRVENEFVSGSYRSKLVLTLLFGRERAEKIKKRIERFGLRRALDRYISQEREETEKVQKGLTLRERLFGEQKRRWWSK